MAISEDFLRELRMRVDIQSVVSPYVNLRQRGKTLKGLCPFHNEKTPSFTVYPETQSFYCFGCGAGGDIITFIRRIENLDYVEAVKMLAERAGLAMPENGYDDTILKQKKRIYEINREAAKFFYMSLVSKVGETAHKYLTDRGFTEKTIRHFGMGYSPDSWDSLIKYMRTKGYGAEELYAANLAKKSKKGSYYDNFRNRVIVPIIDLRGNVVAFGGRVLDDSKPKYVNTSDTLVYKKSQAVFALNIAKNSSEGKMIVVEGYMDVISLHQAGFTNAVASLGTALTQEQARLIARYANEVILSYDADTAGQEATKKAIRIFGETGLKIRVLNLKGGKDPDEIIKKYGPERFKGLLDGAANDIEYKILKERDKFDLSTPDGKVGFSQAVCEILAALSNPIEVDVYTGKLAEELNIKKDAIAQQIKDVSKKRKRYEAKKSFMEIQNKSGVKNDDVNPERRQHLRAAKAEENLIAILIYNPDYLEYIEENISADNFVTSFNKRVFSAAAGIIHSGQTFDLTLLEADFSPNEMGRIAEMQALGRTQLDTKKECDDCIKVILEESRKQKAVNPSEMSEEEFRKLFSEKNDAKGA